MDSQKSKSDREEIREEKRLEAQRSQNIKYTIATFFILAAVVYLLASFVFFKVDTVEVSGLDADGNVTSGSSYYTDENIVAASGVDTGDSLIQLSKEKIISSIETSLPYIGEVTIKRKFPSTLKITVIDYPAKYAVESTNGYVLINSEFKVIETAPEIPDGCATLKGTEIESAANGDFVVFADEAFKDRINVIVDTCKEYEISGFSLFDFTNLADIVFEINEKIIIHLGRNIDLSEKIGLVKKTIDDEMKNNPDVSIIINVTNKDHAYVRSNNTDIKEDIPQPEISTEDNYAY